jgi:hypothetical protein
MSNVISLCEYRAKRKQAVSSKLSEMNFDIDVVPFLPLHRQMVRKMIMRIKKLSIVKRFWK